MKQISKMFKRLPSVKSATAYLSLQMAYRHVHLASLLFVSLLIFAPPEMISWPKVILFLAALTAITLMELLGPEREQGSLAGKVETLERKLTAINVKIGLQPRD